MVFMSPEQRAMRHDNGISLVWLLRDSFEESDCVERRLFRYSFPYISFEKDSSYGVLPIIEVESHSGRGYKFEGYLEIREEFFRFLERGGNFL